MRCDKEKETALRPASGPSWKSAYFTVEMSLILPTVLFVMCLLIHFTFYLYGRCILSQDTYLLAFRASAVREEKLGTDRESYLRGIADTQFGRKYFGNSRPSLTVEISSSTVRVRAETETSHRAMSGSPLMPMGSWTHGAGASARISDPVAHIRRFDRLGDLAAGALERFREQD